MYFALFTFEYFFHQLIDVISQKIKRLVQFDIDD